MAPAGAIFFAVQFALFLSMRKTLLLIAVLIISYIGRSQEMPPFREDILAFHKEDSLAFPIQQANLFIGSSSFTLWKDVNNYFPGKKILNRAFGGSTLQDLIHYRYDVLYAYNPGKIFIYCGENDFANDSTLTAMQVFERFKTLYALIRQKFAKTPIVYVSMKPSPSRQHLMQKFEAANGLLKNFLSTQRKTAFVDVYHAMLDANGQPLSGIWLADNLHMNGAGYAIWQRLLKKHLK